MENRSFPVIDPVATGANIKKLRIARKLTVRDLQNFFGFEEPQAIYRWQYGKTLPSVDNLYALAAILEVPMDSILVPFRSTTSYKKEEQQMQSAALPFCMGLPVSHGANDGLTCSSPGTRIMDFSTLRCLRQSLRFAIIC